MPQERQQRNQTTSNTLLYQQQQKQQQQQQQQDKIIMQDLSLEAVVRGDVEFELDFDFDDSQQQLTGLLESSMPAAAAAASASESEFLIDECDANDHDAIINHPRRPNMPGQQAWLDLRGPRRIVQDHEAEKLLIEFQKTRRVAGSACFFSPKLLYRVSKGEVGEGYVCRQATLSEIRKNVNAKRSKQTNATSSTSKSPSISSSASSSMVTDSSSVPVKPTNAATTTTSKINVVVPKATPHPQPTFSKGEKHAAPVKSGKSTVVVTKRITLRRTILEFYNMLDELDQVPRLACEAQDFRKTMDSFLSLPYTDVYPETPVAQQGYHVIHDAVQILWEGLCKLYVEGGAEESIPLPKHSNSSCKGVPTVYRGRDEGPTTSTVSGKPGRTGVKSRRVSGDQPSNLATDNMEESALFFSDECNDDEDDSDGDDADVEEEEEETMSLSGSPRVRRRRRRSGGSNSKESPKGAVRRSKKRRAKMENAGSQRPDPIDVNSGHQTQSPGRASADEMGSSPLTLSGGSHAPSIRDRKNLLKAKYLRCPPAPFVNESPPKPSMIKTAAVLKASKPIKPVKSLNPRKTKSADAAFKDQAITATTTKKKPAPPLTTSSPKSSPAYMLLRKTPKQNEELPAEAPATEIPSAYRAAFEKLREKRLANELLKPLNGTGPRESRQFLSDWKAITLPVKKQQSESDDDGGGGEGEEALKRSGRRAQIKVHGLIGGSEHSMGSSCSKFKMMGGSDNNDSIRDLDGNSSHSKFNYRQW